MGKELNTRIKDAINDSDLQKGLDKAVKNFKLHRKEALQDINFKDWQEIIKSIRHKNLNLLNDNIDKFIKSCNKNGITVFETNNEPEACQKVFEILQSHNCTRLVKAKSMVSEEIELNSYLEKQGVKVTETDLGEWLVQLAGEKPSHITAPAIHMTKERIAGLLNKKFDVDIKADATEITRFARKQLRSEFIEADSGLTGANLIVAETGSIVIVTNEGNGRLVSTLPNVHIVLTSYDKLVETMAEAEKILSILPKSATGQTITSYVSIISGPSKTADVEKELVIGVHGPQYVYVVLVDNGRKALLNDEDFKDVLSCIKCGACLGMCPVYQAIGGHVFGRKYMGGVGAILTAFIESLPDSKDLTTLCAGCSICKTNCPADIDIPEMILKLKERLANEKLLPQTKSFIVKTLFSNKKLFDTSLNLAGFFNKLFLGGKSEFADLPWSLSTLTQFRTIPGFASQSLATQVKKNNLLLPVDPEKKTVALFSGCLIEYLYPEVGVKAIQLLQNYGYNVIYPEKQTCCGIPALYSGETENYKRFVEENIKEFKPFWHDGMDEIITLCPSCSQGLKRVPFVENVNIVDFSELLYSCKDNVDFKVKDLENVSYHPSCHYAKNDQSLTYTHLLLKELYKDKFIEYYDMYNCCGAAGSYAVEFPDISEKILQKKLDNIKASNVKNIVVDCPGCLMQIKGGISKQNIDLNVLYITDIIEISQ